MQSYKRTKLTYKFDDHIRGSLLNGMFVIPKTQMSEEELNIHRRMLTITATPNMMQRRNQARFGSQLVPFEMYGEHKTHFAVPSQYGLLYFGAPERDERWDGEPLDLDYEGGPLWGVDEGNYNQVDIDTAWANMNRIGKVGSVDRCRLRQVVEKPRWHCFSVQTTTQSKVYFCLSQQIYI